MVTGGTSSLVAALAQLLVVYSSLWYTARYKFNKRKLKKKGQEKYCSIIRVPL